VSSSAPRAGVLGTLAAVLPGGFIVIGASVFGVLYAAARTGIPELDRVTMRGNAVAAVLAAFNVRSSRAIVRAFVGGILANEDAFRPGDPKYGAAQFPRGRAGYYPIGDVTAKLGPAVGPGQVLSGLHLKRLGYDGDPLDLARVGSEFVALYYAARVFREACEAAGWSLPDAIRRYNGSGSKAEDYRTRALARLDKLGGIA
jgi:hypothetical protein